MNKQKRGGISRHLAKGYSKDDLELFDDFLSYLQQKKEVEKNLIPISILSNRVLGPLEAVVKYLRENLGYNYREIGSLLKREVGPIGVTYRNARKKLPSEFKVFLTEETIPISVFKDSEMTIFEAIVIYLKDERELRFGKIAELVHRHYRTVWTVYKRAKIKDER